MTPKTIILTALKSKLEGTDINRIIFAFSVDSNKYNLMLQNSAGTATNVEVSENELNTIKKVLINRVIYVWKRKYPKITPAAVIVQVDLSVESLDLFINDFNNELYKFDY